MRFLSIIAAFAVCCSVSVVASDRDAASLYAQLCANCHGTDLQGSKASSLLDAKWLHARDDAELTRVIQKGIPKSGMPGFSAALTDGETRALVVFIREAAHGKIDPGVRQTQELPTTPQTSEHHPYRIEKVVDGLDVPWSLAFLPDGRLLYTQRNGLISIASRPADDEGAWTTAPIADVPKVWVRDEGGMMALAVDPDYTNNGWLYLTLSDPGENDTGNTKLVRGRIRRGRWTDEQTLLSTPRDRYTSLGINFGSRVVFSRGYLFMSFGERGHVGQAQDISLPNGKIHRIHPDGGIPADNPFVNTPGALPSIWSYGHRNPQGLAVHPATDELWETEHGPRGGDELNRIRGGRNYGWPAITHGMNYNGTPITDRTEQEGMEQPVIHWTPSIAVGDMAFYDGEAFSKWKGNLFVTALAAQEVRRLVLDGDRVTHQEILFKGIGRVRSIAVGPDGFIYLGLEDPGRIVRLVPAE